MNDDFSKIDEELIHQSEENFYQQFLPAGVRSGHSLLYDFRNESDFVPNEIELITCLEAYTNLLEIVSQQHILAIIVTLDMNASELLLAYLYRAINPETLLTDNKSAKGLLMLLEILIPEVENFAATYNLSNFVIGDAHKRLVSIKEFLQRNGVPLNRENSNAGNIAPTQDTAESDWHNPSCFVCEPAISQLIEEKPFQWLETRLVCQNHYNSAVLESGELVEAFIDRRKSKEYQFEGSGLNYLINPVIMNGIYGWNNFIGGGRIINEEIFPSRNYFEFYVQHNIDTLDAFYALYKGRKLLEKEINVDNLMICLESQEHRQKVFNLVSVWNTMSAIEEELAIRGKTRVESPDEAKEIFTGHKKYEHNIEQLVKTVAALLELGKSRFPHIIDES